MCSCESSGREGGFVEFWNEGGGGYVSLYVCQRVWCVCLSVRNSLI